MSDKPTPAAPPSRFLSAALSIFVGSIALYLSMQVLRSMLAVFVAVGLVIFAAFACLALLRLRRRRYESGGPW